MSKITQHPGLAQEPDDLDDLPDEHAEQPDLYSTHGGSTTVDPHITLKGGDAFLIADVHGDIVPTTRESGFFWRGTRFLHAATVTLQGTPLTPLSHTITDQGSSCSIDLTNQPIQRSDGTSLYQGAIHLRRVITLADGVVQQSLTLTSYVEQSIDVTICVMLDADFRDIFEVRGLDRLSHGSRKPTVYEADQMTFSYLGLDDLTRRTSLHFTPAPTQLHHRMARWTYRLHKGQPVEVTWRATANDGTSPPAHAMTHEKLHLPAVTSDNPYLQRLLEQGIDDFAMVTTATPYGWFPYGGVPWYVCPFGRDALITSLEFLPLFPEVMRGTLAFLAAHQGTKVDLFSEEEPGRIFHELRTGEMANLKEIPFVPYYGTVDATPLFLLGLEAYIRWTHDLDFLRSLWPHAQAAAQWMLTYGDRDGDGFLEYLRANEDGLGNQGWKDSSDSVSHADGTLAEGAIALVEVQGYAYAAYRSMAWLTTLLAQPEETARWSRQADMIQQTFLDRFWWEEQSTFYLGLDGKKEPCDVVSSNAAQCLWTGIVPAHLATRIAARMGQPDMESGWGIRTLSTLAARYNPLSYHNGSVWPHDVALIGLGMSHNGDKTQTGALLSALVDVSQYYERGRLPELFCGFPRDGVGGPTQ